MIQSKWRSAVVAGIVTLLALCPPASVLAETAAAKPARVSKPSQGPTVTREQALDLLKRYFPVPEGNGTLEATLEGQGSELVWQVVHYVEYPDGGGMTASVGEIDARTGKLRRFQLGRGEAESVRTGPLPAAYPESYARSWAWLLVKALYPEEAGNLRPAPLEVPGFNYGLSGGGSEEYVFNWTMYHGDTPVEGFNVTVTMDKYTLDYTGVSANFVNLTFPKEAASVTPAQAVQLYRQRMQPQLAYQAVSDPFPFSYDQPPAEMKLVYRMGQNAILDAVSGRFVGYDGDLISTPAQPEAVPTNPTTAVNPPQLPLDYDSAMAFATEVLALPEGSRLQTHTAHFPGEERYLEFYSWGEFDSASLILNSQTGLIREAHRGNNQYLGSATSAPPATVRPEQVQKAKAAAITTVQRYYSQLLGELKLEAYADMSFMSFMPDVPFRFQRYVNGIPAGYDGVTVAIDPETMAWTQLSMEWTDQAAFPKPDGVMTPALAADRFFAESQALLIYQPALGPESLEYGPNGPAQAAGKPIQAMLAYHLNTGPAMYMDSMIDARTGDRLDGNGRSHTAPGAAAKVPAGHWAEGELRYLLERGVLKAEQLRPEGQLTRAEALRLLVTAQPLSWRYGSASRTPVPYKDVKSGDPHYGLINAAIRAGLLRPEGENPVFGGDQPITRAEFAVWMARMLDLDELARSELVTVTTFTDTTGLTAAERNSIAFLQALRVIGGGATFRGGDQLTQAEAAAFTVSGIQHRRRNR